MSKNLYELVGKKIKIKDSELVGKVIEVNDNKITLVNDHGAIFTIDAFRNIKDNDFKTITGIWKGSNRIDEPIEIKVIRKESGASKYGDRSSHVLYINGEYYKQFDTRYEGIPSDDNWAKEVEECIIKPEFYDGDQWNDERDSSDLELVSVEIENDNINDTEENVKVEDEEETINDMPPKPYVRQRDLEASNVKNALGEKQDVYKYPELFEATKDLSEEEVSHFRMQSPENKAGGISYTPQIIFGFKENKKPTKKASLSPYSTREEANKALLDFIENYYKPNKDKMSLEEIYNLYKNGESYISNKQAREEKRFETINKGMEQHRNYLATGGTKSNNSSGYNGLSYNRPINNAGWQITHNEPRNGKIYMSDQICIYGFDRLKYQVEDLPAFIYNEIKYPVDTNDTSKNVFEYADLISKQVDKVCEKKGLGFNSNYLIFNLYQCVEKRLYELTARHGMQKDPRAFDELYWSGEAQPLLVSQITSDDYINSFSKELLSILKSNRSLNSIREEELEKALGIEE